VTSQLQARIRFVDIEDEAGRTTNSLICSLATRLVILHYTSGVSVVGSLVAGLAAAGREVSRTAEGSKLRRAILASRAADNGDAIWAALRIGDIAAGLPPTPVLDHVRNDLALLLADDLGEALASPPLPPHLRSRAAGDALVEPTFLDCLLGLWVHARDITRAVEAIAALVQTPTSDFEMGPAADPASGNRLLR
jgi:hypothetical protein